MHLIKALVLALLLFHIFMNAAHPLIWAAVSVGGTALLFITETSSPAEHLKKNVFIISFAVFFSCFIALSSVIQDKTIDINHIALTAFRIIMVFNIIMLGTMWSGRKGLLFLAGSVPWLRMKLFLILFNRSVYGFRRDFSSISHQIKSRIDLSGRERFLIPRYYAQNIILKDLYSFHHNQAALISRYPDSIPVYSRASVKSADILCALIISALTIADILFQAGVTLP